jgi:two-component system, sensor histidine kinase and response regulator
MEASELEKGGSAKEPAKILVVDDDEGVLGGLRRTLRHHHFNVFTANNGSDGITHAVSELPELILLDLNMPGIDGVETCRKLKSDNVTKGIPIIFLSGSGDRTKMLAGLQAGAVDWLNKPADTLELLTKITTHLRVQELHREQVKSKEQLLAHQNRMMGILAHDLRSPLSTVVLLLSTMDMIQDRERLNEQKRRVSARVNHMVGLIDELLNRSKLNSCEVLLNEELLNLSDAVVATCADCSLRAEQKGITLTLVGPESPIVTFTDSLRMQEVLDNLIDNAIKYSPPETETCVSLSSDGERILFVVEDQGVGIDQKDLPHIFEEFYVANNQPTGGEKKTGLGLAIVKNIVGILGGDIFVRSVKGKGSRFEVVLPHRHAGSSAKLSIES